MRYVTEVEALVIHARIVDATTGSHGVREIQQLRSIIERPKMAFGGKDLYCTVFDKAACYLEGTAKYHVFIDGNKRTSFALAVYFLERNGCIFLGTNTEAERFILSVVTEKLDIPTISLWLRKNCKKKSVKKK